MKANYSTALTAIVLVMGLKLPLIQAQFSQVLLTSIFNNLVIQISPLPPSQQLYLTSSEPPVDGRPDDRTPAGTRATKITEYKSIKLSLQI